MTSLLLAIAIGSEIVATTFLKYSEGFSRLIPTLEWNRSMTGSFLLKGMSMLKSSISIKISQNLTK